MLKSALNAMLALHSRSVTIKRIGNVTVTATIKISPSNYFRNLAGDSEIVIAGREFVIGKDNLDAALFPTPLRGDKIVDSDFGTVTISEVREMFDVGGAIIAYRVRTS
jgi:hypothetical protein